MCAREISSPSSTALRSACGAKRLIGKGGSAESTQVVADHAIAGREGWNLLLPHPPVGNASMEQNERIAGASILIAEERGSGGDHSRFIVWSPVPVPGAAGATPGSWEGSFA